MPIVFTKDEIREFLHEQGFDISDEETLNKFIHDLKKLIKYEDMQRRRRKLGHLPDETILDSPEGRNVTASSRRGESTYDSRRPPENSYRSSTTSTQVTVSSDGSTSIDRDTVDKASRMKEGSNYPSRSVTSSRKPVSRPQSQPVMPKKATNPVAQTTQHKSRLIMKRVTAGRAENGEAVIEESDVDLGPARRPMRGKPVNRPRTAPHSSTTANFTSRGDRRANFPRSQESTARPTPRDVNDKHPQKLQDQRLKVRNENEQVQGPEPDAIFHTLRGILYPDDNGPSDDSLFTENTGPKKLLKPPPHVARDPVALFHWYKTFNWDIYTIPGEDRHMQLRWNVRAKTVGYQPCIQGHPVQYQRQRFR